MMIKKLLTTVIISCLLALPCLSKAESSYESYSLAAAIKDVKEAVRPQPDFLDRKAMNAVYGKFNNDHMCWIVRLEEGLHYCMRFRQKHSVPMNNGKSTVYVLATGDVMQEIGQVAGLGGLYGFIIYQTDGNNKVKIITSKPKIQGGEYGAPPDSDRFTFIKLGSNQYGWRLDEPGTSTGGPLWTYTSIYSLFEGSIKEVCSMTIDRSDYDYDKEEQYTKESRLIEILDTEEESTGFYPLKITVYKTVSDELIPGVYEIKFNKHTGKYAEPSESNRIYP